MKGEVWLPVALTTSRGTVRSVMAAGAAPRVVANTMPSHEVLQLLLGGVPSCAVPCVRAAAAAVP